MRDILELLSNNSVCDMTGNRFWMDGVEKAPGLVADRFSYVTCDNLKTPFVLAFHIYEDGVKLEPEVKAYRWTPAGIEVEYQAGRLLLREKKYITKHDRFVCMLQMENTGDEQHHYTVKGQTILTNSKGHFRSLYNPDFIEYHNSGSHTVKMQIMVDLIARNVLRQTAKAFLVLWSPMLTVDDSNDTFSGEFDLVAQEGKSVYVVGTISHCNSLDELCSDVENIPADDLWDDNDRMCQKWFADNVPEFTCSDRLLEKMYYYRWYMVYKNLINPRTDCFNDLCMYEGKDRFALVCSASVAMHIREMRWLKNSRFVMSQLKTLLSSQLKEGVSAGRLRDMYVSDIPTTVWETYCMLPEEQKEKILSHSHAVKQYVDWEKSSEYMPEGALFPIVVGSWRTAAEYQPSFFEFTEPMWDHEQSNPFGRERNTQLHRVDDTVYLYTNLLAAANLLELSGEHDTAKAYYDQAEELQQNIRQHMWDEESAFFYDLEPKTLRKALKSKNYAGFLGVCIETTQEEKEKVMEHLLHEFHTPYPIPSVAIDCPAFSPDNTWKIGPHASEEEPYTYACCWNGPSWNFSNSLVIDILGKTVQSSQTKQQEGLFADLFKKWCQEQCASENDVPNTCEHYNSYTGEALRDRRDYSHSTFIDIVMRRIIGFVENNESKLICKPLNLGLSRMEIWDVPYCGHRIGFSWNQDRAAKLQCTCDDRIVYESDQFTSFTIDLKEI